MKYLLNTRDPQRPVYEVDHASKTYRLISWEAHGADRLPNIAGKFKAGFTPPAFREVAKP